jgi:Putative adhesin
MLKTMCCALLLTPALVHATEHCSFQAPRTAAIDLNGVRTIVINVGYHDLHLVGSQTGAVKVEGRACASSATLLGSLQLTQRREGDRLILTEANDNNSWNSFGFFHEHYAYLDLHINVPANLPVELEVGSGDADVVGVSRLNANTHSGDLHVHGVNGRFDANVGSGDVDAADIGEIHVGSVGSGDFKADRVRGDVQIGSIGSGDATLHTVGGSVDVGSVGSGDLRVNGVTRDLHVHSVGSGDVVHTGIAGRVDVPKQD